MKNWNGKKYDDRHGGAFDRGSADAYYRRPYDPHFWTGGSYNGRQILEHQMGENEIEAYKAGWEWQHSTGVFKY